MPDPTPDLAGEALAMLEHDAYTATLGGHDGEAERYAHAAQCVKAAMTPVEWQVRYRTRKWWGEWMRVCGNNAEEAARNILAANGEADCQIRALFALATGGDNEK